ncbi:MAG: hypothetical protein ABJG78_02710 [Cyclobacteriaceae bacterium]
MNWLIALVSVALVLQIVLFIMGRRIRRKEKENSIIEKYDIRSRQRAWQLLGDTSIPDEDREKIRELYEGEESEES